MSCLVQVDWTCKNVTCYQWVDLFDLIFAYLANFMNTQTTEYCFSLCEQIFIYCLLQKFKAKKCGNKCVESMWGLGYYTKCINRNLLEWNSHFFLMSLVYLQKLHLLYCNLILNFQEYFFRACKKVTKSRVIQVYPMLVGISQPLSIPRSMAT